VVSTVARVRALSSFRKCSLESNVLDARNTTWGPSSLEYFRLCGKDLQPRVVCVDSEPKVSGIAAAHTALNRILTPS
jgi:hypothetical protein